MLIFETKQQQNVDVSGKVHLLVVRSDGCNDECVKRGQDTKVDLMVTQKMAQVESFLFEDRLR